MDKKPTPKPTPRNARVEAAKRVAAMLAAKKKAAKKVNDSYKLPGGGTKYDSYGKTNEFNGKD